MDKLTINLEVKLSKSFGENGFKYKVYFRNNQNNEFVAFDSDVEYPYKGGFGKQLLSEMTTILNKNKELMDILVGYISWRDFLVDTLGYLDLSTDRIVKGRYSDLIETAILDAQFYAIKKIQG